MKHDADQPGRVAWRRIRPLHTADVDRAGDISAVDVGQQTGDAAKNGRFAGARGARDHGDRTRRRTEIVDAEPGAADREEGVVDIHGCPAGSVGRVPAVPAAKAAQLKGRSYPAGVLERAFQHGDQGPRAEFLARQPEGQADGTSGVGERRKRGPRDHQRARDALERTAAGKAHKPPGYIHPGVDQAESENQASDRQGRQHRVPQPRCGDRAEQDDVGERRRQPDRRQVEKNGTDGARPLKRMR